MGGDPPVDAAGRSPVAGQGRVVELAAVDRVIAGLLRMAGLRRSEAAASTLPSRVAARSTQAVEALPVSAATSEENVDKGFVVINTKDRFFI